MAAAAAIFSGIARSKFREVAGLAPGTSYCYRVRASNMGGDSPYSDQACGATLPAAPAAPSGLVATAASGARVTLRWKVNGTGEDGFRIERRTGAGPYVEVG